MVGGIIFLVVAVFIIYLLIDDKKKQEEVARKEARKKEQEAQEKRELEQQTIQKIQAAVDKIQESDFYKRLLPELKIQIQKILKEYLKEKYDWFMKRPHAVSSQFNPFSEQYDWSRELGRIVVTSAGVYYSKWKICDRYGFEHSEFQFVCSENGYSNMDSIQMVVLAQKLSDDLGYQVTGGRDIEDECRFAFGDNALRNVEHCMRMSDKGVCIELCPCYKTGYLSQLMDSELDLLLKNSNISYKSPF